MTMGGILENLRFQKKPSKALYNKRRKVFVQALTIRPGKDSSLRSE
jgi:hypothetical protein